MPCCDGRRMEMQISGVSGLAVPETRRGLPALPTTRTAEPRNTRLFRFVTAMGDLRRSKRRVKGTRKRVRWVRKQSPHYNKKRRKKRQKVRAKKKKILEGYDLSVRALHRFARNDKSENDLQPIAIALDAAAKDGNQRLGRLGVCRADARHVRLEIGELVLVDHFVDVALDFG